MRTEPEEARARFVEELQSPNPDLDVLAPGRERRWSPSARAARPRTGPEPRPDLPYRAGRRRSRLRAGWPGSTSRGSTRRSMPLDELELSRTWSRPSPTQTPRPGPACSASIAATACPPTGRCAICPHCGQRQTPPECPPLSQRGRAGLAPLRELRRGAGRALAAAGARLSGAHPVPILRFGEVSPCPWYSNLRPHDVVAIIMGGGAGTRLFPLTKDRAKPAVPLAGKYRLVDIPISNCLNSDLRRIFLLTQFNSGSLHRHIQESYRFDTFSPRLRRDPRGRAAHRQHRLVPGHGRRGAAEPDAHRLLRPPPGADPVGRPALPDELPHHPRAARRQRRGSHRRHDAGRASTGRRVRDHGGG